MPGVFDVWRAVRGSARVLVRTGCFLPRAVDLGGQSFWLPCCLPVEAEPVHSRARQAWRWVGGWLDKGFGIWRVVGALHLPVPAHKLGIG